MTATTDDRRVSLDVPARRSFVKLVRLAVGDAAARGGLGIAETDALSVAAGEVCVTLLGSLPVHEFVHVDVDHRPGRVDVMVRAAGVPALQLSSGRSR